MINFVANRNYDFETKQLFITELSCVPCNSKWMKVNKGEGEQKAKDHALTVHNDSEIRIS